jgi:DNA mismatch repair protein MutS
VSQNTPLIQQYLDVKARHPDSLLFFRVGDFYEMFFEDAEEGSGLLGLTLTSRNNGGTRDVPLAGVPVKAASEYVSRLLRAGRRVAICEQLEDVSEADGIVRRDVVEIITPGTVLENDLLSADRNNYVATLAGVGPFGLAAIDLSTGEFELSCCEGGAVADELARLEPSELLLAEDAESLEGQWLLTRRPEWRFDSEFGSERLQERFGVLSVEGFGLDLERDALPLAAAGALLAYLEEVRPAGVEHLRRPRVHRRGRTMYLDEMTRRNLELVETIRPGPGMTLLRLLDRTRTPMGGRLLRRRLLRPLLDRGEIDRRLAAVEELAEGGSFRRSLRTCLGEIRDLERLAARISTARAGPRELLGLGESLAALPAVEETLRPAKAEDLRSLGDGLDLLGDVDDRIRTAISTETPATLREGGVIRTGFSPQLDELRAVRGGAVDCIAGMQIRERERTGIDSLKVGFNKVFGYYIEVTKAKTDRVPDDYVRKQTLVNAERYLTPELKEWEAKVVDADDEIATLEARLFQDLREEIAAEVSRIQDTAARIAELDVLASLAEVAERNEYVRPQLTDEPGLEIRSGRHPVVEQTAERESFIPNDVVLDDTLRVMIVTGPNMAGKSTVLRQVGLIVLMAQIGSFVPAARARIGVCDRVFTRVGASDNLAAGMSTFMVEMTETATILNSATENSLVLLDEIGRGTSTYDGVSIAWAVTERLHELGARTIFATHYHELVSLEDQLEGVGAFNVAIRERGNEIVFLHRLLPGGSDRSYGVHVARLAGLPPEVVGRAGQILLELENGPHGIGSREARVAERARDQLSLFRAAPPSPALERLAELDLDHMTPLEALNTLAELRAMTPEDEQRTPDRKPDRDAGGRNVTE